MTEGPYISEDKIHDAHGSLFEFLTGELEQASRDGDDNRVTQIALLLGALGVLAAVIYQ